MPSSDLRGRFIWHELMTTDPNAAKDFYGQVVGWGTKQWEGAGGAGNGMQYTMFTNGDQALAGLMALPKEVTASGVPPHWLTYVSTPDVDRTVAEATRLGATVTVAATDIPEVGRFAVLTDPQGAVFAVFTPQGPPMGGDGAPRVREFSWHELATMDQAGALEFYSRLFGWSKVAEHDMGPMGTYLLYGRGGQALGGIYSLPADQPVRPHWLAYAKVDDVRSAATAVARNGGSVLQGPTEVPGGDWIAMCRDPQGGAFALHGAKRAD